MKRLLFPCFLVLSIFCSRESNAQVFTVWLDPNGGPFFNGNMYACPNPTGGPVAGIGAVVSPTTLAYNTFAWSVSGPTNCASQATVTPTTGNQSSVTILYPCCGVYTVITAALNTTLSPPTTFTPTGDTTFAFITCPNAATITVGQSAVCQTSCTSLTGNGATSYSWYPSVGTPILGQNPVSVCPTVNTTYTMIGTTAQGCTVTAVATVSVTSATLAVTPQNQSMCAGSPVCFTASAGPVNSAGYTPGTTTTSIQWYDPTPQNFASGYSTCTTAIGGNFQAVLTYTGTAGTCSLNALSSVIISTNISVSASSHSNQVCPGGNVTLTAVSIQTAGTSYTWTAPGNQTIAGNPVVLSQTAAACYVVDVLYFGCPGSATVCVGQASLTPVLSSHAASICPGSTVQLCGSGGSLYTYYYQNPNTGNYLQINPVATTTCVVHSPSVSPLLPATYSVFASSSGCTGSAVHTIYNHSLYPTFGTPTRSVCPNNPITFTIGNVGTGNFTATATYPANPTTMYTGPLKTFNYAGTSTFPKVYTLVADSAGCRGSTVATVGLLTLNPTITASSASTCPSRQFTLYASGGAGTSYSFFANYVTSAVPPASMIPNPGATYSVAHTATVSLPRTYTVQVDSAGCVGSGTYTMGVIDLSARVGFSVSPSNSVCPGSVITLSASGGQTYTFTAPAGTVIPKANPSVSVVTHSLVPPGTYTVKADSLGCTGIQTLNIYLRTLNPSITAAPNPVCAGMPVVLNSSGGTGSKYTFLRPDPNTVVAIVGTANQSASSATHNPGPSVATVYTVVVDSANCMGRDTVEVFISPGLSVTAVASTPTVCSGTTATLSAFGPTNALYSWTQITGTNNPVPVPGGSNLSASLAAQGVTVNPTVNTQYIVYAVDPAGCTGTAAVNININPTASLSIVLSPQSTTICPQQSATLSVSGTSSYTWFPSSNMTPSANSPTVVVTPAQPTTYTVLGTNNLGCYGTGTVHVHVGSYPIITFAATAYSVCPNFNSTITAFGAQTYTWTGTTFSGSIAQQSVAVGPGCYTVVGSNGGTCLTPSAICIGTAQPLKISVVQSSPTTCIGSNYPKFSQPVTFTASGAGSYVWQIYDPAYMTYSLGPVTTVRPPSSTCYTVTGYTSICAGQAVTCVTVAPQFSMNVTPPLPAICEGDSVRLSITNIGQPSVGRPQDMTYRWQEPETAPLSLSETQAPVVVAYPPVTSAYSVEVFDVRQCASLPKIVTVTVFPRPITAVAIPTINNVPTNTLCYVGVHTGPPDVVLTLVANNKNQTLPFGVVPTYTWLQPYKHPYFSILTPPNQPQVTVSAPMREPSVVVYTVVSGYNGVPGCAEYDTVSVRVVDCRPVRTVTMDIFTTAEEQDTICARECITFLALSDTMAGGPQTYTWTFFGGQPPVSYEKNPIVCYNLPGYYDVILKVENPYPVADQGSSKTVGKRMFTKVVDVPNISIVNPGGLRSDTTVRFGTPVNLKASGGLTYNWAPNYNITSLTDDEVTVKPFRSTRYIVTGYNSKNCASSDTIDVIVIEDCGEMFVPNAFSPNGDGHNDVLKVQGICLETLSFMIFNRWGEKVFETTDQSVGWDGTFRGDLMNTGVFVYRLEGKTYDGKAFSSKGNITLVR